MRVALGLGALLALSIGALVWMWIRLDAQDVELSRMAARVHALELTLEEEGGPLPELDPGRSPRAAAASTAERPLELDSPTRARLIAAPGRDGEPSDPPEQAVRSALLDVLATEDPELREGFRNLVREEQQVLRDERRDRQQARWEQRTTERLGSFASEQGLSQAQQDALFALLTAARDRMGEVFREVRDSDEPPPRDEIRARMLSIREDADKEARELLDAKQFEAYETMRDEEGLLGRGPGGRRRGGGGPPAE